MQVDDALIEFATVRDLDYIEAVRAHGSFGKAATALGLHKSTLTHAMKALRVRAAKRGYSPKHHMTETVPDGFLVKGTSTLFKDGKPVVQWVKSAIDSERQAELMRAAVGAMSEEIPRAKPQPAPKHCAEHLCNVYTLTDSHVGMLAWHKEGGADWDLSIAEKTLVGCFEQMVMSCPKAHTAVVAQLGDYLHYDSALAAVTPTSGHSLDADGRMPKMVKVAIRILRHVISFALERHARVIVLLAEGNHDISSSVWLRAMFQALYENEPRVEVIDSELPYYAYQHGKTMLAWHHGHLSKNDQLPILFASQFPQMRGATEKRYAHTGHRHHKEVKEHSGITVQQHTTIAARDSYAARGGWTSERGVEAITYHSKFGQAGTVVVTPEMLMEPA
jgi:hypothetical protein